MATEENHGAKSAEAESEAVTIRNAPDDIGPVKAVTTTGNGAQAAEDEEAQEVAPLYSNFSISQKRFIVTMVTLGSIFSPLSGTIYLPALNSLSRDLRVSPASINLTVTSYQIFQGLAPLFFGDLADVSGRRPVYLLCFVIYFFANLGLAIQRNYAALFVLRALQSTGSSGTIALSNGVMADIVTSAERGEYVGWAQAGTQLGPALGPTLGGLLSQFLGWQAIFWFLCIIAGVYLVAYVVVVPETARNVVGNGSIQPQGWNRSVIYYLQQRKRRKAEMRSGGAKGAEGACSAEVTVKRRSCHAPNPFEALRICLEKDLAIILFNISLMVTATYCLIVPYPSLLKDVYGFNDFEVGLCYLPFSAGSAIASVAGGKFLDYNYRRTAAKLGMTVDRKRGDDLRNFPIEKARLEAIGFTSVIGAASICSFGWAFHAHTSLAVPLVIMFLIGLTLSGSISMYTTLIVDLYPQSPATAMAAVNITRCSMSAAGTAVVQYVIERIGVGWCFTLLGGVFLVCSPSLVVVVRKGPRWREVRRVRLERRKAEKDRKREVEREKKEQRRSNVE